MRRIDEHFYWAWTATSMSRSLKIKGMTCTNCAAGIERHLKSRGFKEIAVSFAHQRVALPEENEGDLTKIAGEIRSLGYQVSGLSGEDDKQGLFQTLEFKLVFCAVFTAPLLLHMFFHDSILGNPFLQLGLCTPVYIVGLLHFGKSALASVRSGIPNMDVLILIGITSAFGYSLYGTVFALGDKFLFYETAATITTLVLLGNFMELSSVRKTGAALRELEKFAPTVAKRVAVHIGGERIEEVAVDLVEIDDFLIVGIGDQIPVDGVILQGSGLVDEAMISGESRPVDKSTGESVLGGTTLVEGNLRIQATAVGGETVLSRIISLVESAQDTRPKIQRLGDLVSSYFVFAVLLCAVFAFALSFYVLEVSFAEAMLRCIAVLVIACPCAMGLATPTAVAVGLGRAAREGILFRGGDVAERFGRIRTFAFDKTGTLTDGEFKIRAIEVEEGCDVELIKSYVLALEQHSSHPLARSLVSELASVEPAVLSDVREDRGYGMLGITAGGARLKLGSFRYLGDEVEIAERMQGASLYLLEGGRLIAALFLQDVLRNGVKVALQQLHRSGVKTVLISGDRHDRCEEIARELQIDEVYSEQLPDQKLSIIKMLGRDGDVAFIGDGVNDAPALAGASIGVSFGAATDIAVQSAQVVILGDNFYQLVRALELAGATLKTIKQNLFWAFFYNVVAIPVAAAGYLHPMVAALTMAFSDVVVIGNSLRLRVRTITSGFK